MKKCKHLGYSLSVFLILISTLSYAQMQHIRYQVPDSLLNDQPFAQLDTSSFLTTGVLWDRAKPNLDFLAYQGYNDGDTAEGLDAFQAYLDLYGATVDTTNLLSYDSLLAIFNQQRYGFDAIPIMTFVYEYQKLKPNAYANNLVSVQNSQLVISNPALNPFETKTLWLAGTRFEEVPINDTFAVVIPGALFFDNSNAPSDTSLLLEINLDDGQGFQSVTLNQKIDVYYSGEGNQQKKVQLKWLSPTGTQYATMQWKTANPCANVPPVDNAPWPDLTMNYTYLTRNRSNGQVSVNNKTVPIKHLFESSIPYLNKTIKGKAYIRYRTNDGPNPTQFKKPLIFIEGIDLEPAYTERIPQTGFIPFAHATRIGSTGWPELWGCGKIGALFRNATPYLDSLTAEGYDIIMLDFFDGDNYIQRNAFLLVELIQRINANKIGNEGNVILGPSMGGIVANYAISYMEQNNLDHCTRLNASLDSPWKGAHIPLAIQVFLHYATHHQNNARAREKLNQLHNPASKQLLNYHIWQAKNSHQSTTTHNRQKEITFDFNNQLAPCPERLTLMQELQNLGNYPKQCRNIAIVNGNNQGNPEYAGGSRFLEHNNDQCAFFEVQNDLYAANSGASASTIAVINGAKGADKHSYRVKNMVNIYNAPSSWRDDITEIDDAIRAELRRNNCETSRVHIRNQKGVFISSVSALNVGNTNWHYKIDRILDFAPRLSELTHFDSYIAPSISEPHVMTTPNNMAYFINEVRRGANVLQIDNGPVLTKTWNNPFENSHLASVDINQGGTLYLNANRPIYDGLAGQPSPLGNSLSRVRIGDGCSPIKTININQGGALELGSVTTTPSIVNKAYLQISNGAVVNLNVGGALVIHPGSKIIVEQGGLLKIAATVQVNEAQILVEEGGALVYENTAAIALAHVNSEMIIQGKLTVAPNTNFTFTGAGKLVFDQNIPWVQNAQGNWSMDLTNFMEIGANATFKLSNPSPADKYDVLLECRQSALLKDALGNTFTEVEITNGTVELEHDAFLFSFGKTDIVDAAVNSTGYNKTHGGIRIWNSGNINRIRRTDFRRGMPGVLYHGFGQSGRVEISNCLFTQNQTSVKVDGGNFRITQSNFNYNTGPAVEGNALSATSIIGTSNFDQLTSTSTQAVNAIHLVGQQGSMLNLSNNQIKGYAQAVHVDNVDINATCNTIEHNSIGLQAFDALVYMQEEASNTFRHNSQTNVDLIAKANGHGIFLRDGHNFFDKDLSAPINFAHIAAQYDCFMPLSDYRPGGTILDFNHNNFVVNPVS